MEQGGGGGQTANAIAFLGRIEEADEHKEVETVHS